MDIPQPLPLAPLNRHPNPPHRRNRQRGRAYSSLSPGFPALFIRFIWQRALFTLYGVNIESVTMVVTAFMLGLGLGSLLGGMLSRSQRLPLLRVFGLVELLIACYGIVSLRVFHWAASVTAGSGPLQTGLFAFTLVVLPTVLMGSTLPILVSYPIVSPAMWVGRSELYTPQTPLAQPQPVSAQDYF